MKRYIYILLLGALALVAATITSCDTETKGANGYSITVAAGPGGSIEARVGGKAVKRAAEGAEVILTATPDDGYRFTGWRVESGNLELSGNPAAFTMPAESISVAAEFAEGEDIDVFEHITDPVFKKYCEQFDTDGDGILSLEEAREITEVSVREKRISSLAGIEYFTSLRKLECYSNRITSIDVSKNTALTSLGVGANLLSSLDISKNTELLHLWCYSNQLTSLDLSNNPKLEGCDCAINELTSLDVSLNTKLRWFCCSQNPLGKIDVSNNPDIFDLRCSINQLTSLDVSKNTKLTLLECVVNSLTELDISNNTALEKLYVSANSLTSLEVSKHTRLVELDVQDNWLTEIDLSQNTALTYLRVTMNEMFELDASNMANPTGYTLLCGHQTNSDLVPRTLTLTLREDQKPRWNNELKNDGENANIIVAEEDNGENFFEAITDPVFKAYCGMFDINEDGRLSLTEVRAVTGLNVGTMGIASLAGIEHFTEITVLSCPANQLTSLDVSKNTKLVNLICLSNQLTSLNVSGCTALKELITHNNRLTTLDVSDMSNPDNYNLQCGGQTSDGSTAQTLTLTMREEQKPHWKALKQNPTNSNVSLAE